MKGLTTSVEQDRKLLFINQVILVIRIFKILSEQSHSWKNKEDTMKNIKVFILCLAVAVAPVLTAAALPAKTIT